MTPAFLFVVGDRRGSLFALLFFAVLFGAVGILVARGLRRPRLQQTPGGVLPALAGWSLFLAPDA